MVHPPLQTQKAKGGKLGGSAVGNTVIYLSLKAFGLLADEEGSEFVTLNRKVEGSDKSVF